MEAMNKKTQEEIIEKPTITITAPTNTDVTINQTPNSGSNFTHHTTPIAKPPTFTKKDDAEGG